MFSIYIILGMYIYYKNSKMYKIMHAYNYYVLTQHKFCIKSSFKSHYITFYLKITYFWLDFPPFKRIYVKIY